MKQIAPDVWQLEGWPPNLINTYLIGDVLVDAGTRWDGGRILRVLRGRAVSAHALTHAHPDHLGSSHAICEHLDLPFWVGEADVAAAESPDALAASLFRVPVPGGGLLARAFSAAQAGSGHPVTRRLREGDEIAAGFRVLETPGHTRGHVAYWRESDRVLIAGDVLWNFQFVGLSQPLGPASTDPARNRASARRQAELEPAVVCFGHGPPLRDSERFADFVAKLPRD